MKKSVFETLNTITASEEWQAYAEEHWEDICAYVEEHWEEIHPEVPRDQWDVYCEVKEEVEARRRRFAKKMEY